MRPLAGIGLAAASCAALVGAWRIGDETHQSSTAAGAQVLSSPQGSSSVSPSPTPSPGGRASTRPPKASASHPAAVQTVNGALVNTQYGTVQVQVVVTGGRLTDVHALKLTDSSSLSVAISAQAAPILRREALAAGSAQIDAVSGASYTSQAYAQSLQSALDAARAAA